MQALRRIDPDDPAADARSFGDWLAAHHQSSGGDRGDLGADRATDAEPARRGCLARAGGVRLPAGVLSDAAAGDVGYARVPLGEIHDLAARRALAQAGVEVRLRRGVTAIDQTGDGFQIAAGSAPS